MLIIMLGVAGSGKSTQSKLLSEELGYKWLSTSSILKQNISKEYQEFMLEGKILDDKMVIGQLSKELSKYKPGDSLVLDGFPRDIVQAKWLLDQIRSGKLDVDAVVHLNANLSIAKKRLILRGRQDDYELAIKERFKEYKDTIKPILSKISHEGIPVIEVSAEQPIEKVLSDILKRLEENSIIHK